MQDGVIKCKHCGSPFCYEKQDKELTSWNCINCGFSSNSYLVAGSEQVKTFEDMYPELYNDIKFIDENGFVWFPMTVNMPLKGMIFPNGTSKDNWHWSFAKAELIPEMEKFKYPDPAKKGEYMTHRINVRDAISFKQNEFRKALEVAELI